MSKLPHISSKELIRMLNKLGFVTITQRGSHIKLRHKDGRTAIVPNLRDIKPGTLKKGILNPNNITVKKLLELL